MKNLLIFCSMVTISATSTCANLIKIQEPKESNLTELIAQLLVEQKKTNMLLQTITEQNEVMIKHNKGTTIAIKQQTHAIKEQTQVMQNPEDTYNDAPQSPQSMPLLMPAPTLIHAHNASLVDQNYAGYQGQQGYSPMLEQTVHQGYGKVYYLMQAPYPSQPE